MVGTWPPHFSVVPAFACAARNAEPSSRVGG